jgi:hypothetical protein
VSDDTTTGDGGGRSEQSTPERDTIILSREGESVYYAARLASGAIIIADSEKAEPKGEGLTGPHGEVLPRAKGGRAARAVRDRFESTSSDSGSDCSTSSSSSISSINSSSSISSSSSGSTGAKPIDEADMEMFKKLMKRQSVRQLVLVEQKKSKEEVCLEKAAKGCSEGEAKEAGG